MKTLGVIQARGGSKRIPRKNIKLLKDRPLIAYVIAASLGSKIDRLIVSTEDPEISKIARKYGAECPFQRPPELSADYVPSEEVTRHALQWMKEQEKEEFELVVTLQPTTPFLLSKDIDACLNKLEQNPCLASCFTAKQVKEPPHWMYVQEKEAETARLFLEGDLSGQRGISQKLPRLFLPNGGAYATRVSAFLAQQKILSEPTSFITMSAERSIDLDEPLDWFLAEALAEKPLPLDEYLER